VLNLSACRGILGVNSQEEPPTRGDQVITRIVSLARERAIRALTGGQLGV